MLRDRPDRAGAEALEVTARIRKALACFAQRLPPFDIAGENECPQSAIFVTLQRILDRTPKRRGGIIAIVDFAQCKCELKPREFAGFTRAMEQKPYGALGLLGAANRKSCGIQHSDYF